MKEKRNVSLSKTIKDRKFINYIMLNIADSMLIMQRTKKKKEKYFEEKNNKNNKESK